VEAYRLLATDRMAYKTLKDEMPVEYVKAFTRALSRGAMSTAASKDNQLAGLLASVLMDVISSQMVQSFRNWEMLPNSGYLAKFRAERGTDITLRLNASNKVITPSPEAREGQIFLVSYLNANDIRIDNVAY
jgi:hypothetical protein